MKKYGPLRIMALWDITGNFPYDIIPVNYQRASFFVDFIDDIL
jgi:hypothetical protein